MSVSRRSLLAAGASSVLLGTLPAVEAAQKLKKVPKNIIFCVSDGMAISVPTMADHYMMLLHAKRSYWMELMDRPEAVNGLQETRSLNSLVTDSSAASSAWGGGRHIWNGMLNMFPDLTAMTPLAQYMTSAGVRMGLVTTATMTHATPAGFTVSHQKRDDEAGIAEKYLESNVDVFLGGGNRFFAADKRKDGVDLYAKFRAKGYQTVQNRDDLMAAKGQKLLGIFSESHIPYTIDRDNDPKLAATVPTLAEMSKAALDHLKGSKKGFLLQIEGARIDHAGHGNDFGALLHDQLAFEEAVRVAIEFAMQDKETLVIVTTDHCTGGPALNGDGDEYSDSTPGFMTFKNMKSSYGPLLSTMGAAPTATKVTESVKERLGLDLKAEDAEIIAAGMGGTNPLKPFVLHGGSTSLLGQVLSNYTKVSWTSNNHTADHVIVTAIGPGAEFARGYHTNTQFFDYLLALKGIKAEQPPQMRFDDAARFYERLKGETVAEVEPHWS
jgi:alkaline phosphatase